MNDCEGWPIVPGARVRVEYPRIMARRHAVGCARLDMCGCPSFPMVRNGMVAGVVESPPSGRPFVEVVEFDTCVTLTPSPDCCRVMRGKTQAQVRHELSTTDGLRAYKRRAR